MSILAKLLILDYGYLYDCQYVGGEGSATRRMTIWNSEQSIAAFEGL